MAEISVIVPIYNVEKYLRQCLDSIVNQTFKDIEIILVDDGSPDKCPQICDEYAQKDDRIKVIHKENGGYGSACNRGIEAANGNYIGLVESDDWIEPDMYEKLYNQITKFDAEVCIASFYSYKSNSVFKNGMHDEPYTEIIENTDNDKLFSIFDHPFLFTLHPALWAKLYKKDLIKSIKFDEQPGAAYQDIPFATELFSKTKKIIGLHENLYHYRIDNNNSLKLTRNSKKRLTAINQWQKAKEILIKNGLYDDLKEEFYFKSMNNISHYRMISSEYKKQFFQKFRAFLSDLENDDNFTYKYFTPAKKHVFKSILANNFRASLFDSYKGINILGLPLIEKTKRNNIKKIRIFNIPIYKKYKRNGYNIRKYLFGLIKTKRNQTHKKIYLLGIQISCKKLLSDYEKLLYYENLAKRHHTLIFKKYKNINEGKDLVIFACGPSAKYYQPVRNAVHIGINRAFYFPNVKFDYLFFHDLQFVDENMAKIKEYDADKFCAYHTHNGNALKFNTTSEKLKYINAKRFYLSDPRFKNPCEIIPDVINPDITSGMFYDRKGGSVMSALQFALYTHPKRIYLVGCDCSEDGYFYSEQNEYNKNILLRRLPRLWSEAAYSIQMLYPDIEVISINPVGLKGMFKDVYTQSYADKHTELLNKKSVNILKPKELIEV